MKTMTIAGWTMGMLLAAALAAGAQAPGGGRGPQGGGPGGLQGAAGGGELQQPPSVDEIVQRMLADFDADKDGKLSADELKKSVEARRQARQGQGGRGGMPGGPQGNQQGGPQGERPTPPAPDQMAAKMMEGFDADKNGSLNAAELQKALEAHRPPQGGPRGGQPRGE